MLGLLATACVKTDAAAPIVPATATRDNNLALGNPSGATTSTSAPANNLLVKDQYTLAYNRDWGSPNWVSGHLSTVWGSSAPRKDDFAADASLPAGWYRVEASNYSGAGSAGVTTAPAPTVRVRPPTTRLRSS